MVRDNFLDTNVIFNYSNYHEQSGDIVKKCYFYICNKPGKFLICGAVLEELSEIIKVRARIHSVVIKKIEDPDYSFENNSSITFRDIPFAKKLYEKFKNNNVEEVANNFRLERRLSEIAIQKFLETSIGEKVIPIEQIQTELVNKIHNVVSNHADCKILASALQLQKNREIFLFVTADGKDLSPNHYSFLRDQFDIDYPKENWIFPELFNLMFKN
jgi:hypothetical protein